MGSLYAVSGHNDLEEIKKHYDVVSPYYESLWGEHIHHGYWVRGDETKEVAQSQLVDYLAESAGIEPGCKVLDVGCGIGGSSVYLAKRFQAQVTGITISPVQVEMARKRAAREGVNARFLVMNAESMEFDERFDVIWSVESISHYSRPENFFARARKLLKPRGTLAITDWFKKENLTPGVHAKYIPRIEKSMMVQLHTMAEYEAWLRSQELQIGKCEILNQHCAKTWEICLDIINNKTFWKLAAQHGEEFLTFLRGFKAMRAGFSSGNFIYGLLVAKPEVTRE